jgi:hypothetical protein
VSMIGEAHSLKVEEVLFEGKSDYQKVMVFQVIINFCLDPSYLQFVVCHCSHRKIPLFCVVVFYVWQGARAGWSDSGY